MRIISASILALAGGLAPIMASEADPLAGIAAGYEILSPGSVPQQTGRTAQMVVAAQQLSDRCVGYLAVLPPAETWGGNQAEFIGIMQQQVKAAARLSITARDDNSAPVDIIVRAAEGDVLGYIASSVAARIAMTDVAKRILPEYLPSIENPEAPLRIIAECERAATDIAKKEIRDRGLVVTPDRIGDIAIGVGGMIRPAMERTVAMHAVLDRVNTRIDRGASLSSPELVTKAKMHVKQQADAVVLEPYTPGRMDQWSIQLTSEAQRILSGEGAPEVASKQPGSRPGSGVTTSRPGQGGPGSPGVRAFAPPRTGGSTSGGSNAAGGSKMVGLTTQTRKERKITIPQGSHGNCYLLHGVEPEIGGKSGNPAMFSLAFTWRGPNGSIVPMKNLRLIGTTTANAGSSRVSVQLNGISYVFPDGRALSMPIAGYIVDASSSQEGMPGKLELNLERIAPYAMLSSGAKGLAEGLQANNTVQVVGDTTNVISQTGDKMENALYSGIGESASFAAKYFDKVLEEIKPTVRVDAGKQVTAFITQPVVFDIPEDEFGVDADW